MPEAAIGMQIAEHQKRAQSRPTVKPLCPDAASLGAFFYFNSVPSAFLRPSPILRDCLYTVAGVMNGIAVPFASTLTITIVALVTATHSPLVNRSASTSTCTVTLLVPVFTVCV